MGRIAETLRSSAGIDGFKKGISNSGSEKPQTSDKILAVQMSTSQIAFPTTARMLQRMWNRDEQGRKNTRGEMRRATLAALADTGIFIGTLVMFLEGVVNKDPALVGAAIATKSAHNLVPNYFISKRA